MIVIPALIDTTSAAMPARRNIGALSSGLWWATTSLQQTRQSLDVASRVPRCQGRGYEDAEALHGGAVCALGTVICFVLGAVAMGSSGVGVLIPETGPPGARGLRVCICRSPSW